MPIAHAPWSDRSRVFGILGHRDTAGFDQIDDPVGAHQLQEITKPVRDGLPDSSNVIVDDPTSTASGVEDPGGLEHLTPAAPGLRSPAASMISRSTPSAGHRVSVTLTVCTSL